MEKGRDIHDGFTEGNSEQFVNKKGGVIWHNANFWSRENLVKLIDPFCDPSERVEMTLAHASESGSA